ncbi:CshA/CshB family fibrillar adhesin-related protein [Luteimicrobium sp. DT211]|uniref:CshA/CshB family fibrillar adhesin-related protein n=1 Tax=Luteimicrobium sp. DT211 TaxID=3393412 RepID=UPI003CF3F3AF
MGASVVAVSAAVDVATAPDASATFATGGAGLYKGSIDWFDLGTDGVAIQNGASHTNTRTIGDHELATTCTVNNIDGAIQTYRSGDYHGDAFDDLYNVGGADDANTLVAGIANAENAATVSFDFSCGVTFDGAPLQVGGLVFADAESSNLDQGEYVAAKTTQDVTWRVIDRYRNCDTSVEAWLENDRLQLGPDGTQCSQVNDTNGPTAVGFMQGATSATVQLHGGGTSAVAVGVVLQADFGDAPASYGEAGALEEPEWTGGVIEPNTVDTQTNVSDDSFTLGTPTLPAIGLGATVDSDATYLASADASGDDKDGQDDEDAINGTPTYGTTWGDTVTQDVVCRSDADDPGYVTGWIDWNANGAFDPGEASDTVACSGGSATLSWTVPDDAVDSPADHATFLRLRIAPDQADSANATGIVQGGEVEDHRVVVDVPNPGLTITKTADPAGPVVAGDTVDYTITVKNTGEVAYTADDPATFSDDLTDVLDDATYTKDAKADVGDVSYAEPTLSWSGPLAVGDTATITYSVTVNDPDDGDGSLTNTVVGPAESNCAQGADDPDCSADVLVRDLEITKTADTEGPVERGGTITYTVTVENTGAAPYTADDPATFTDDTHDLASDAPYNGDAKADVGTVDDSGMPDELTWSGPLEPGQKATITYSVTVAQNAKDGASLDNSVFGPPESNCLDVADCRVRIPVTAKPGLDIAKTSDAGATVSPGDKVTYTVKVTNTGNTTYTADDPATFTDDLSNVLDDATYDDASTDVGTTSYTEPTLSWSSGDANFAPGDTATITYAVIVLDPAASDGDGTLTNTVVGPDESNCADGSDDADCSTDVPVQALHIVKSSDGSGSAKPGDTVTYTVTVENTGQVPYTADDPATFDDDLADVIDDATYNDDASADIGTASYSAPTLSWSGALEPGAKATITYTVTVNDPDTGDGRLFNVVVGPDESNCTDPASTDPDCVEPDPVKKLEITKTAAPTGPVNPGDTVTYTIKVTNTGGASYTATDPATFTDDLTKVIDDATYDDDAAATSGDVSYAQPTLSWSGGLEPGDSATITYSVKVNDPVSGDGTLDNAVVGPPESNCDDGTETGCTTDVPVQALQITKTADPTGDVAPGDKVTYTVTVKNQGAVDYTADDPATFSDDLTEILDDARYDDAAASSGQVTYVQPTLSWSGALAAGDTATVTYSVIVNDPVSGDGTLTNAVVGPPESNCDADATPADPDCGTVNPVRALQITKTANPSGEVTPGDTVTYTVTVTNTGGADYTADDPATFSDDLTSVLDDATWNDDADASSGTASYTEPTLSWSGALAAGDTATVTYSVTVNDPVSGDGTLTNAVVGPDESNCDPASVPVDADCSTVVPVRAFKLVKSSDTDGSSNPGDTVTYTITVTNTGQVPYTDADPAEFSDDLSDVLDDATYNGDADASVGTASYAEPTLSWSGALAPGATATITYTVTVNDPDTGDGKLFNVVVGPDESNCTDPDSEDPDCVEPNPVRGLHVAKTSDASGPVHPGDTVTYTVTVENTGNVDYTADDPASFTDDLSKVIDDATYNDDAAATAGTASYAEPTLSWSGALAAGATATITYSVTVNVPVSGDGDLANAVVGPDESNCDADADPADPDCSTDVPVQALEIAKTADPTGDVAPGGTVTYTVTVKNNGSVDYTDDAPATFSDDLSEVIDDATYDGDASATVGEVSYAEPTLSWSGALAAGDTSTVTYSVTVNDPLTGDGTLTNAVVGPDGSNCVADADGNLPADCVVPLPIRALQITKTADPSGQVVPGGKVTYTVKVTNTGAVPYTNLNAAAFSDDLTEVLDDATYDGDATASSGTASYTEPTLAWRGSLAPGETATITYSVTVNDPDTGDGTLTNAVVGPPESNCVADDDGNLPAECQVPVEVRQLEITKTADPTGTVSPGDKVTYTVKVTNTGGADYTADAPATFSDDLTKVLDDATYDDDAAASAGDVTYAEPQLAWSGALAAGDTATITYSVTVNDPVSGDGTLTNAVVGPDESNCDADATPADPDCGTVNPVKALEITKTADPSGEVTPGSKVTYTVTVKNTGGVDYTADDSASFSDDLTEVLGDATYDDDASADVGTASYAEPTLSWSGALAAGATATITYTVTVNDPPSGDGTLTNAVVGPDESNCDTGADPADPDCGTVTPVRALEITKTADPSGEVTPGSTVTYTVKVTNSGQVDYTADDPATFSDDLTEVLDDATYDDDASADVGTASYDAPNLSWSGALAAGDTATITYSVTVNDPDTGDGTLTNAVVGPDESNCDADATPADPDCDATNPVKALQLVKTSDSDGDAKPGDTVTYTVEVTNTGQVPYTADDPATFTDDLTDVLDDATYNADAAASSGTASYDAPKLAWSGALAPGEKATVTYSVTVDDPDTGDGRLFNVVIGPDESNCTDPESTDPNCVEPDPVKQLEIAKTADPSGPVTVGDKVTYTVKVTNTGTADYTADDPATGTDVMTGVLDDATYDDDVAADTGKATFDAGQVAWSGALPAGDTATITYSVTVNDPMTGDGTLANAVLGPEESNCPVAMPTGGRGKSVPAGVRSAAIPPMPEGCQVVTPVRAFEVSKTVDKTTVDPGDEVTYTVTVKSLGTASYTDDVPASFTDDLSQVLDDGAVTGGPTTSAGTADVAKQTLSWSGPLPVGGTVTVTYVVTVDDPDSGDGELVNVVSPGDGSGGMCVSDGDCTTHTDVTPPVTPTPTPSGTTMPTPTTPGPTPGPTSTTGTGSLATTGSGPTATLVGLALLAIALGAVLYGLGWRRRRG